MDNLRKRTAFLLIEHKRLFNQNPSKRALMDHIKALQKRAEELEKIVGGWIMTEFKLVPIEPTQEMCAGAGCTDQGCPSHYANDYPPTPEVAKLVEELSKAFPLLDETYLDPYIHHCVWCIQQERIRLHSIIAALRNQNGGEL